MHTPRWQVCPSGHAGSQAGPVAGLAVSTSGSALLLSSSAAAAALVAATTATSTGATMLSPGRVPIITSAI
jgi:hypothetical protein